MKFAYLELCGFRGYRRRVRIDFAVGFTVIEGRNGVGKSTVFDAIEFALTGDISKYRDMKADGETVADYIWWTGGGESPEDHFVEIGLQDGSDVVVVRRTPEGPNESQLVAATRRLCDVNTMPASPLRQLCAASILRDELIATLSLDLKEAERFAFLSDALGGTDADVWIKRGATIVGIAKKRAELADVSAREAAAAVSSAGRRMDELRAGLRSDEVIGAAWTRLQSFASTTAPLDQIAEPARIAIAALNRQLESLRALTTRWDEIAGLRVTLPALRDAVEIAARRKAEAEAEVLRFQSDHAQASAPASQLSRQATDLAHLVEIGRRLGRLNESCPLCTAHRTSAEYGSGLEAMARHALELDREAVQQADRERTFALAQTTLKSTDEILAQRIAALTAAENRIADFELALILDGIGADSTPQSMATHQTTLKEQLAVARADLSVIETLKINADLERAASLVVSAQDAHVRCEQRLGVMRRAEGRAQALYDASRRSAGEAVDVRLERVLPLMAELYRRLRPHPLWDEIDYKVRGDVRRFLSLQVGNDLNPQFMFSSGQRRATGLAFLLAVNLSLAWSRLRSVLLDDPVQHVDDFRSVHLAEVLAQIASSGRQIICAVEDAALAELLCRRLPGTSGLGGIHLVLGVDEGGDLAKLRETLQEPFVRGALVAEDHSMAG